VTLDNFDFDFNKKMNRSVVFDLATAAFVARHDDALFLGPPGTGKSHLAQAIGKAVIDQGYRVIYREAHILLEQIAEATLDGNRKEHMELLSTVPLLIIDDLGMHKLGPTAAEELLELAAGNYPMHRIEIEQIADHDFRTHVAQCLRALVFTSHHRTHRFALPQQQLGDRAPYCADAARRASNQNGNRHVFPLCVYVI
jgi:hypothetical protein